jgi:transposase
MRHSIGRPRKLTSTQVSEILSCHEEYLAWRAARKTIRTQRELAQQFGVSQGTIAHVVKLHGLYKTGAPRR